MPACREERWSSTGGRDVSQRGCRRERCGGSPKTKTRNCRRVQQGHLWVSTQEDKNPNRERHVRPSKSTAADFTAAKMCRWPHGPCTDNWMRKSGRQTMQYHSAIEKKEILPFTTTWMDPEGITLSETRQRKTNTVCFHSCGIKRIKTNEQRKKRLK